MRPIRTIVAAVDFSPHSEPVVDAAVTLAKQFGAKIRLVHAYDVPIPLVSPYEVAIPEPYLEETRRMAAEKLPAAPAIVRAAEEAKADLVVIGTRGHTGLKHLLLGSVAERTVRLAPCPVLTVKAGA
jgi:nucleotide-binding universal stress UspA family protein